MTFNGGFGIERELAPGERLLWKGRPQTGIKFRSHDWVVIPFSLVWCGLIFPMALQTIINQLAGLSPHGLDNDLTILFLGLLGLYLLAGRFMFDSYARSKMEYALTDRRALVISNVFSRKVQSIDYRSEPNISLSEYSGGSGTIYFGEKPQGEDAPMSSGAVSGFDMIDNARDVYQRILKAKER